MESVAFAGMLTGAIFIGILVFLFLGITIGGIVCLMIFIKNDSRGNNPSAALPIISALLLGISGFVFIYIYVCLVFGITFGVLSEIGSFDSNYPVIDYVGEDYEYFTVDGERYDLLELTPSYHACYEIGEEKYLEEYEGEYYTYYSIPNEENFDLIYDGYLSMYAPAYQHDDIYREYEDEYGDLWIMYGDDFTESFTWLSEDVSDTLTALVAGISENSTRLMRLVDPEFTDISLPSEDGIFDLLEMVVINDSSKMYILTGYGMNENEYYLYEIPAVTAAKLSVLK